MSSSEIYKELDRGDGICKYLKGNLCSIYKNRPMICRIDEGYEAIFRNYISKDEYYKQNYRVCEILKNRKSNNV